MVDNVIITKVIPIVNICFQVYTWILLARILMSWFRVNPYSPIVRFIVEITEPVLKPCRRLFPPSPNFPVDFSPIIAFIGLNAVRYLVVQIIMIIFA